MVATPAAAEKNAPRSGGHVVELADTKDLGSFGESLAGSTPVVPTISQASTLARWSGTVQVFETMPQKRIVSTLSS
jgi:hypothetical protein